MPEKHLRHPEFTYSASGPFTKNKEIIKKFKETGDTKYIYKNELDKVCFQHVMAYGDFKDLARRTVSDKDLRYKAFNIAKNPKYGGQRGLNSMVYKFSDKISAKDGGVTTLANKSAIKNQITQNQQLAEELHKPVTRTFKKEQFIPHLKTIFVVLV